MSNDAGAPIYDETVKAQGFDPAAPEELIELVGEEAATKIVDSMAHPEDNRPRQPRTPPLKPRNG